MINTKEYITLISTSKSDTEVYLKGKKSSPPILLVKRQPNIEYIEHSNRMIGRCYVEHIQNFFIVLQTSQTTAFDVYLVNEKDAFSYQNSIKDEKLGLLDLCLRDGKCIRLTAKQDLNVDLLNTYQIIDMDIMKVVIFQKL